jgi:hypothetical protein
MSTSTTPQDLEQFKLTLLGLDTDQPTQMKWLGGNDKSLASMSIEPADVQRRLEGRDCPADGLTMVGMKRLENIQACIERVVADGVPGDIVETGVWRGGTAMFMRAVLKSLGVTDRVVYAADSFEGLPVPDADQFPIDKGCHLHEWDHLAVSLETVRENFERYGLLDDQVQFVKGWFRDTMPTLAGHRWAILRLDGDMYESTMEVLEHLYPDLSPGGYVIFDDYKIKRCREAVHDFRDAHGISEEIVPVDWTGVYWQKAPQ